MKRNVSGDVRDFAFGKRHSVRDGGSGQVPISHRLGAARQGRAFLTIQEISNCGANSIVSILC